MLGGIFEGIGGIINAMMQAQAMEEANAIARENLEFQKEVTGEQLDLAKSARVDAYGNITQYDDRSDTWKVVLTPQQRQLMTAGEREQLASLLEDAPMAREFRERQDVRSRQAGGYYQEALEDFFNKMPQGEAVYQNEAIGEVMRAMMARQGEAASHLSRAALRQSEGGQLPYIMRELGREQGTSLPEAILAGKEMGTRRQREATGAHRSLYGDQMKFFADMADKVSHGQPRFGNAPETQANTMREMLQAMGSAFNNRSSAVGSAYNTLGAAAGRSPQISGLGGFGTGLDSMFGFGDDGYVSGQTVTPGAVGGLYAPPTGVSERVGTPSFSTSGWLDDDEENVWTGW